MPRSATRPFQPPHLSSTMETLKSIFTCCIPGRRSRSQQSQSQSGQHTESTPLLHGQSGLAQQSSKSPNAPSTSIQKAGARGEASSSSSSSPAPVPTYTIRDLAVITGWAREHFLQVNDAGVFEQRSSRVVGEGAGKRKSLVEPVALAEAQVDKEKDAKVQSLVENLAKGIAFNGWSQEGAASGSGSGTVTEEQKEGS